LPVLPLILYFWLGFGLNPAVNYSELTLPAWRFALQKFWFKELTGFEYRLTEFLISLAYFWLELPFG